MMTMECIYDLVKKFGDTVSGWFVSTDGEIRDPVETIYGEGYAPGPAAFIFASLYAHHNEPKYLESCQLAMNRIFSKIQSPTDNSKFTDIFMWFFALKTYGVLMEDHSLAAMLTEWKQIFQELDHFFVPGNTNACCLLLATTVMRQALSVERLPREDCPQQFVDWVRHRQCESGFIEDHIAFSPVMKLKRKMDRLGVPGSKVLGYISSPQQSDMKPIAYHLFSCALLMEAMRWVDNVSVSSVSKRQVAELHDVIIRGVHWLANFVASDGSLTMAERSRDQFWTAGVYLFVLAMCGVPATAPEVQDHLSWWTRFLREDGTVSVAPNYFSSAFRVGFEYYSNEAMYNTLGFAYLCDALRVWATEPGVKVITFPDCRSNKVFVDRDAGYIHMRHKGSSLGIALRRHRDGYYGGYVPAMGILNVVLDGSNLRPLPQPCYRYQGMKTTRPRFTDEFPEHGVYDGLRVCSRERSFGIDTTSNCEVSSPGENQITLRTCYEGLQITKTCVLQTRSLLVRYRCCCLRSFDQIYATFPLLISDGRTDSVIDFDGNKIVLRLGTQEFSLACLDGDTWVHDQSRYTLSTSGVTSQVYILVGRKMRRGTSFEKTFVLERLA